MTIHHLRHPARTTGRRTEPRTDTIRYRLLVVASAADAVIPYLGGWIFDLTAAGWEVGVALTDPAGSRALAVLGATALEPPADPLTALRVFNPHALATTAAVAEHPSMLAHRARSRPWTLVWDSPAARAGRTRPVRHRTSQAGSAFKQHALAAAGVEPAACGRSEILWTDADEAHPELHHLLALSAELR